MGEANPDATSRRIAALEDELDASRRTIDALMARVEMLEQGPPAEADAMARALAGMQRELAHRTRSLEATEASWRALYESSPDPMLTVDGQGTVVACNRTSVVFFARPLDELVGRAFASGFGTDDALVVDRLARSGWTGVAERRFVLADGRIVTINASPIEGADDGRFHVTLRDVTTRQVLDEAEDQRRRLEALAELAASLARELNDPMSIVQGRLELLLELGENDPAAIDKHLRVALEHARRISATLRNLRLVGRANVLELDCVYLSEALDEALDLVGPRARNVDLRIEVQPSDLAVGGDAALFARVFANLISHALDVSSRGSRLELRGRKRRSGVAITLTSGSFGATTARRSGSGETVDPSNLGGFGLAVADMLVRSVGGRIEARRFAGGVAFEVKLPHAPERRSRARPVEGRVLVVGREELARSVEALLDMDGFAVVRVPDADRALAALEAEEPYAGIVTDLFLQGISGLSLADAIVRRRPWLRGRVLLVTEARLAAVPPSVVPMTPPLRREDVLEALGRKVRRRR